MAWLSSVSADNTIIVSEVEYVQRVIYALTGYVCKRTVSRTETHYVGLTSAAASTQLSTSAGTAGCVSARKEQENSAGAYRVVEEIETYGEWEYDETWTEEGPPA